MLAAQAQQVAREFDSTDRVREFTFRGPWFTSREAAAYVGSQSLKGFYEWCRRHAIVRRGNRTIAKADLDRVLKARRPARVMAAASLANLRKRHAPSVAQS